MNLLMMRFCKQLRCNVYNNINCIIRRHNCVSSNKKPAEKSSTIESIQFPGYKVIYAFPYIIPARILNKVKYTCTIFVGASMLITSTLQILDFMSLQDNLAFIYLSFLFNIHLHACGYLCNNVVGSICYKDDDKCIKDQEIVISYINYWGKRIDLKTTIDNVTPFIENPSTFKYLFETTNVKSRNRNLKLKIYLNRHVRIIDKPTFHQVFGS